MTKLPAGLWQDLLGVPFVERGRSVEEDGGLDCFGVARIVCDRMGVALDDPGIGTSDIGAHVDPIGRGLEGAGFVEVSHPAPGDLVMLDWGGCGTIDHIGVCLGEGLFLHVSVGTVVHGVRIAAAARIGALRGYFRAPCRADSDVDDPGDRSHRGTGGRLLGRLGVELWDVADSPGDPGDREALVTFCRDPLTAPNVREMFRLPCPPGTRVRDLVPVSWKRDGLLPNVRASMGTDSLCLDDVVPGGARLAVVAVPAGPLFLQSLLISVFLSGVSFVLQGLMAPDLSPPAQEDDPGSPAFNLSGLRNTALPGLPIPVVYGEHIVGGNIIQVYVDVEENGKQALNMLIGLCSGPIDSIGGITSDVDNLTGSAIPADIKFDGSPAQDFAHVRVSLRMGNELQLSIPGFGNVVNAVTKDHTLIVGEPLIHTTENEIDAFDVILSFPQGMYNLSPSGNLGGRTVQFDFSYRVQGTTTWTTVTKNIWGMSRGPISRSFKVEGLARETYEIKAERITPAWPETDTDKESKSVVSDINEITQDELAYPGMALVAIRALSVDDMGGRIPNVTSVIKGKKVWVPSAVTNGVASFPLSPAWTDNPAWCALDMILDPVYGVARMAGLSIDDVDLDAFDDWADLCDTMVDDGRGSTTERARCDMIFDRVGNAWEYLVALAKSHWANVITVGNKLSIVTEEARSAIAVYGMANLRDVATRYESSRSRPKVIEVQYPNEETDYEQDLAQQVNPDVFTGTTPVKETLRLVGVTRPAQAYRMAMYRLNWADRIDKTISFKIGVEGIHLLPGDVVAIAHESNKRGVSGKCASGSTSTTVKLDVAVTVGTGYTVTVLTTGSDGQELLQEKNITGTVQAYAAGDAIPISGTWTAGAIPAEGDNYTTGLLFASYRYFVLTKITTNEDMTRNIEGVAYVGAIYTDDPGDVETFTDEMPNPRKVAAAVSNVALHEGIERAIDGSLLPSVVVTFARNDQALAADVYYVARADDDDIGDDTPRDEQWIFSGRTFGDVHRIIGFAENELVHVSVVPVAPGDVRKSPVTGTTATIRMCGRAQVPTDPDSDEIVAYPLGDHDLIRLPKHPDVDVKQYEIRLGSQLATSVLIGCFDPGQVLLPRLAASRYTYIVSAINTSGVRSGAFVSLTLNQALNAFRTVSDTQNEHTGWTGTKSNTEAADSSLVLTGTNLTGTYVAAVTPTTKEIQIPHAIVACVLADVAVTWEHGGFAWNNAHYATMTFNTAYVIGYENADVHTWEDADAAWQDFLPGLITWNKPDDLIAGLASTLEIRTSDDSGATWTPSTGFDPYTARELNCNEVEVRLTLNRPHSDYVPEATAMITTMSGTS